MMQEQLRATLKAALPGVPVDWVWSDQGAAVPRVVLQIISEQVSYTHAGPSGYVANRVQIDIYAPTYRDAKTVADTVNDTLSGLRAGLILGAFRKGRRDYPPDMNGMAAGSETLARISVDYMIHHNEE
jgi:hypothetical protein